MIAAILRAQLLSMRLGSSRGAAFSLITGIVWYGFWGFVAFAVQSLAAGAGTAALRVWAPAGLSAKPRASTPWCRLAWPVMAIVPLLADWN